MARRNQHPSEPNEDETGVPSWNRLRSERRLRSLTREQAARQIGISVSAVARGEREEPLSDEEQAKLYEWMDEIGRARERRLDKLESIAQQLSELPAGLGEAVVISLAKSFRKVFAACHTDTPKGRYPLYEWQESVERAWEEGGGLLRAQGHPDVL